MKIRFAVQADAKKGVETLRRSIVELCLADHCKEQQEITGWLANKTIESWASWVNDVASRLYVADNEGGILGVGMISAKGEILLNYVNPDVRFHGVSKALLEHMEVSAVTQGLIYCSLESTKTAYHFYLKQGYKPLNVSCEEEGLMTKKLT